MKRYWTMLINLIKSEEFDGNINLIFHKEIDLISLNATKVPDLKELEDLDISEVLTTKTKKDE